MIQNGCTLHYIVAILVTVTYTMGATLPDADDSQRESKPFWLLDTSNLNSPDAIAPSYFESRRYADSQDPALLGMRGDVLPETFKRGSYDQIYDQNLPNMYKRGSLNDLIRRLNAMRGNPNKKGTPRATMVRFGFAGKRK